MRFHSPRSEVPQNHELKVFKKVSNSWITHEDKSDSRAIILLVETLDNFSENEITKAK